MSKGKYLRKQKVSTGKKIGRAALIILLVLVLLIGAVVAFVWSKLSKITYDDGSLKTPTSAVDVDPTGDSPDATDPDSATEEETEPEELVSLEGLEMMTAPIMSSGKLFENDDVMNILVVGTDEHVKGFVDNARGDLNMLISINKKAGTVKLVSFSRGIGLPILEGSYKGKYDMLTHVHRWAGTSATLQAMEDAFKIEIDHYVRVNFNTVIRVIDAIGGIEIELTKAEADYMNEFNETVTNMASTPTQKPCVEGVNHLDGGMACHYARLRGVDDDWVRMDRQRTVVLQTVEKLKGSSFSTLNELCDMVLPLIQTNLSTIEIAELILYSPKFLDSEFDQLEIPIPNSYGGMTVMNGGGAWALNYEKNNAVLHEFLYGAETSGVG